MVPVIRSARNRDVGGVSGRGEADGLRVGRQDMLKAVVMAGFFKQRYFQRVHLQGSGCALGLSVRRPARACE
ncbi:protein of unknown function [Acidithiobacillus ferrivorans]|uniref:Uncharacterized protein n=1 Tax=Acidithiobacillus ferrivorans TaxID=160808 RepID=A0A060US95_9PROT|nr:hypothetical protein AFERRI_30309 [Acidithiobacillus ferrivorans]SMH67091.1 protein of unknown function [Acidithiobacillus ferrivorans]